MTTLEYPLNEKMRAFLRTEELLQRLYLLIDSGHPVHHHFAVQTLFDLQELCARTDIKSDLIKDLERQRQTLESYRGNPGISEQALDETLQQVDQASQALQAAGKPGQQLAQEGDGLSTLKGRIHIASGTCAFDTPAFHHWKQLSVEKRQLRLNEWATHFDAVAQGLSLYLGMVRQSASSRAVVATAGQFQQNLAQNKTFQMLRVSPHQEGLIPEISANRLLVMVRWLSCDEFMRTQPMNDDVPFNLALCSG